MSPVLLCGNMCDARMWAPLVGELKLAGAPIPRLDASSIVDMARSVLDQVDGPLLPLGFSMGGIVALELAREAPDRIAALALLDTNAAADLPARAHNRPRQQAAVRAGELERIMVDELKPAYLGADRRQDRHLLNLLRDMALALGPEVFVRQSEALRTRADLSDVIDAFPRPIFLACGAEDALCPPAWHEAMAARAHISELHIIAGAGHMLPLEQPGCLAQVLRPWLNKVIYPCPIAS